MNAIQQNSITKAPRRERPTPAPRRQRPTPAPRRERPTPKPRKKLSNKWLSNDDLDQLINNIDIPKKKTKRPPAVRNKYTEDLQDNLKDDTPLVFKKTPWVIGNFLRGWVMRVPKSHRLETLSPIEFLNAVRPQIKAKLEEELKALKGLKFQLALRVELSKRQPDDTIEYIDATLRHNQVALLQANEIDENLNKAFPKIQEHFEKWTNQGSGWVLERVDTL